MLDEDIELIDRLRNRENIRLRDIIDNNENIKVITDGSSFFAQIKKSKK